MRENFIENQPNSTTHGNWRATATSPLHSELINRIFTARDHTACDYVCKFYYFVVAAFSFLFIDTSTGFDAEHMDLTQLV